MLSFKLLSPLSITPSAGTFSPGLTRMRAPLFNSAKGTSRTVSFSITCASAGIKLTSNCKALDAPSTERISIQCPSSMITISVTSSQKKSLPSNPNTTAELYAYATEMATAIRVIMPGAAERISFAAPVKKGQPPWKYATVDNPKSTYKDPGKVMSKPRNSWIMGDSSSTGIVIPSETQKRMRKSAIIMA